MRILVAVALMIMIMVALSVPAFAQGCSGFGRGDVSQGARAPGPYGYDHVRGLHLLDPGTGEAIRSEVGPNGSECSFS
jgi:hypothetical protein